MKIFLTNALCFMLLTIVFYLTILFFWGASAPKNFKTNLNYNIGVSDHLFTRLKEVKNIKDVDILFLGASNAYRGFDNRIFAEHGLKTFNLGSGSQTPSQTATLLKRYIDRLNPKMIVYAVGTWTFELDGVESSIDIISNDKNDFQSLKMICKLNNMKTYNTFLYAVMRDLFGLDNNFKEPRRTNDDNYIAGGYVEKDLAYFKTVALPKRSIFINENQVIDFQRLVSYIIDKNIKLKIVYPPVTPTLYNSHTNNSYFDSIMNSCGDYYNFNKIISLNDSIHFYDAYHQNQNGVDTFNHKLIEILKK